MKNSYVPHLSINTQHRQDDTMILRNDAFKSLIHSLVEEHGTRSRIEGIDIRANDLSHTDRKLILGYFWQEEVIEVEELEDVIGTYKRVEAWFTECKPRIQKILDDAAWSIYCDKSWAEMEEAGMFANRHNDNGEVYWTRR